MKKYLKVPVLFLVFNRPETTKFVFEEIKKYKPRELFVAADGPRDNKQGEKEKCEKTRKITEKIDWNCKVKRLYREKNLGCRKAVSSAIEWFFEKEKEGIILEDDTLPNQFFFHFMADMLDKYRNDKEIMHITGGNFLNQEVDVNESYYFSKYIHIWGWATWRRAWKLYDVNMKSWNRCKNMKFMGKYKTDLVERIYWKILFNAVKNKKIDTWDYQWVYSVWANGGLGIIPARNMIKNIGFGKDATHTKSVDDKKTLTFAVKKPYKHPKKEINKDADKYTRNNVYNISIPNVLKQYLYYEAKQKTG